MGIRTGKHGNVGEWCADWYHENFYRFSPPVDPPGPPAGSRHSRRGGSWQSPPAYCRAAYRCQSSRTSGNDLGLRLAVEMP